jgi:hypothetical protein
VTSPYRSPAVLVMEDPPVVGVWTRMGWLGRWGLLGGVSVMCLALWMGVRTGEYFWSALFVGLFSFIVAVVGWLIREVDAS